MNRKAKTVNIFRRLAVVDGNYFFHAGSFVLSRICKGTSFTHVYYSGVIIRQYYVVPNSAFDGRPALQQKSHAAH